MDELKKPSDLKGGTLKERYHIPEGYNKLLQKIEKAREVLKKINFSLTGDLDLDYKGLSPEDYRRSVDPLFDFVMEYTDNGMVNPGREHEGEDFSGLFISSEFVAYSVKRKQGKGVGIFYFDANKTSRYTAQSKTRQGTYQLASLTPE